MKKQQKKTKEITAPVYMMNRELSWLKFNERVLNEAGNPRVPLAERLTFAAIYQSNLDEFYRVRVGTLMDQMEASEVIRENKTNMTSEEQVTAILQATRDLDQKKAAIYEQLMGELEPYGVRLINFNRLSAEEGKLLETYFDQEIAPYLSANIVSKQQPFPFLKNKNIYAVASLMSKGGKTKTAIIPCSNTVFRRLIDIPTRKGTFMLSEELILHFLPKMFKNYEIREKALLRITRNADIDTETIYDEDLDYRDAMENLIKQRRRMNPVRMELSRELNKKMISSLCKELHVDKKHVFLTRVPLDMSFVFGLQGYLRNTAQDKLFYQRRAPRMTPELDDKSLLISQIMKKDVLLSYPFENIKSFINLLNEAAILAVKKGRKAVSQKDLEESVEVVLVGKEKKDRILSKQERRIVSYHEVGHALVNALQKDAEPVQKITIVPRTMGALGYVMQVPEEEKYLNTKKELEAMLVGYLGGRAAEEIVFDTVTTGAANDIEQATKVARAMITQYGMSEKFGLMGLATQENQYLSGRAVLNCGDDTATEIDHEVMKLLHHSYEEAKRILGSHRTEMDKIAEYLIRKETITGKEFMKILRAVQQGLDIPENLDDLVLSEDEKEVSNKQDIEMIAENNEAAKSTESVQFRPEISGQELTEDMQAPEKTEESAQTTDSDHAETEEKPGSQA